MKQDTPAVSVEWAEQLIRSALARAGELGLDVSVVVVDQRGEPVATSPATSDEQVKAQSAANRAYTAVGFALSTSQLNERSLERAPESLDRARLAAGPGAIPIGRPYVVGAIGVAGGTPEQDEQCCRAAVTGS
ncbi:MAG: heme-binding protein [Chloroflexi bacterium]|nr:heme-binding protein [Chloroflexota bacterium]